MSGLDNEGVTAAAEKLDAKLTALAEQVTGTRALAATVITNSRVPAEPRTDMRISTVEINVEHVTIDTDKPYLEVTARIEGELKRLDDTYRTLLRENRIDEVRSKLAQGAQPNGLMLHYIAPHGDWLALVGQRSPGIVYHIGNVSMAVQMTQHTLRAGLYAPLRVAVYGNSHGGTTFEFDKPSSQFGQFHDSHIDAVAKELDKRLLLLIEKVSR
jgi:uncharacterized protein (DUF302 family)